MNRQSLETFYAFVTNKLIVDPASLQRVFLFLTLLVSGFILCSTVDFSGYFAQGDHGLHLYVYSQTAHGALPYRDYWWCYGPLMPFYYALCLKLFGFTIPSVLAGQILLNILSAAFFFLVLARFCAPLYAFASTVFFITQEINFPHTQNHAGAITLIIVLTFFLSGFLKDQFNSKNLLVCSLLIFLLGVIKINFGAVAWLIVVLVYGAKLLSQEYRSIKLSMLFFLIFPTIALGSAVLVYVIFLIGEPFYYIKQNFLLFGNDQVPRMPLFIGLNLFSRQVIDYLFANPVLVGLLTLPFINILAPLKKEVPEKRGSIFLLLALIGILSAHEFILSGFGYRWLWAKPSLLLMVFLTGGLALRNRRLLRYLVSGSIVFCAIGVAAESRVFINSYRKEGHYFDHPRGKAFITNDPLWKAVVLDTVSFLQKNLTSQELFFALPYEPIYYYLLDRPSPTRYLNLFKFLQLTQQDDEDIIRALEVKKVNWIAMSNRTHSTESGLGQFGITHCQLLSEYINKNFGIVAEFGPWDQSPGWGKNHAVRILRRIKPF